MELATDLLAGRLGFTTPGHDGAEAPAPPVTAYGSSRLGLVPRVQVDPQQVVTAPAGPLAKRTFKLPAEAVIRLKAYATVTEQYQYVLMGEALNQYLRRVSATLGFQERGAMDSLIQQYRDGESPPVHWQHHHPKPPAPTNEHGWREVVSTPVHAFWLLAALLHLKRPAEQT